MNEAWKTVAEFPDYAVSSEGKVRRIIPDKCGRAMKLLSPIVRDSGYLGANLYRDGKAYTRLIHRLLCIAFRGDPPSTKHQASHRDGTRINNRIVNIRWATPLENTREKYKHGTIKYGDDHHSRCRPQCMARGIKSGSAKIDDDIVKKIRKDSRSQRAIAVNFGISQAQVCKIKQMLSWKHVA